MANRAPLLTPPRGAGGDAFGADLIELLERRVAALVDSYRKAKLTTQDLRGKVAERDQRIRELTKRMESSKRVRGAVRKRIQTLMAEVEKLERAGARQAAKPQSRRG